MMSFYRISLWIFLQFAVITLFAQTTYTSVQAGDWSDPDTWGLITGDPTGGDGTVENEDVINIIHELDYDLANDLDIIEGEINISHKFTVRTDQNIIVREDGILTCTNGTITIPITDTDSNVKGNLQVFGGISFFENATIEIDHDWEGTDGAMRTAINCCMMIGANYINDGATDKYIDVCIEYGLHGAGDFDNNSVFSSIDCTLTTFLDRGFGNFTNVGKLFSSDMSDQFIPDLQLLHVAGDLSNTGLWYAEISNYCVEGLIDDMQMGTASINDDLPGFEFCVFAMAADCACPEFNPPAPVEFIYFRGSEENNKSHLEWATSQEINNKGFEIQRSKNGQTFESIGFVEGNGTVSSKMEYQFVDMTPFVGENIYRLKQVDYNGSFKHSNLVSIPIESRMSIEAIPNPARSFELSMLYFNDDASNIDLIIYDTKGAVIYQNSYPARSGGNQIDLSDLFLIEGIYFVQARAGIHTSSSKFIIIK